MNTKMIRYILGKMLGVEAALLLLPAFSGETEEFLQKYSR